MSRWAFLMLTMRGIDVRGMAMEDLNAIAWTLVQRQEIMPYREWADGMTTAEADAEEAMAEEEEEEEEPEGSNVLGQIFGGGGGGGGRRRHPDPLAPYL